MFKSQAVCHFILLYISFVFVICGYLLDREVKLTCLSL